MARAQATRAGIRRGTAGTLSLHPASRKAVHYATSFGRSSTPRAQPNEHSEKQTSKQTRAGDYGNLQKLLFVAAAAAAAVVAADRLVGCGPTERERRRGRGEGLARAGAICVAQPRPRCLLTERQALRRPPRNSCAACASRPLRIGCVTQCDSLLGAP